MFAQLIILLTTILIYRLQSDSITVKLYPQNVIKYVLDVIQKSYYSKEVIANLHIV